MAENAELNFPFPGTIEQEDVKEKIRPPFTIKNENEELSSLNSAGLEPKEGSEGSEQRTRKSEKQRKNMEPRLGLVTSKRMPENIQTDNKPFEMHLRQKNSWTPEEQTKILNLFIEYGKNWRKISDQMSSRGVHAVRGYFYSSLRRLKTPYFFPVLQSIMLHVGSKEPREKVPNELLIRSSLNTLGKGILELIEERSEESEQLKKACNRLVQMIDFPEIKSSGKCNYQKGEPLSFSSSCSDSDDFEELFNDPNHFSKDLNGSSQKNKERKESGSQMEETKRSEAIGSQRHPIPLFPGYSGDFPSLYPPFSKELNPIFPGFGMEDGLIGRSKKEWNGLSGFPEGASQGLDLGKGEPYDFGLTGSNRMGNPYPVMGLSEGPQVNWPKPFENRPDMPEYLSQLIKRAAYLSSLVTKTPAFPEIGIRAANELTQIKNYLFYSFRVAIY